MKSPDISIIWHHYQSSVHVMSWRIHQCHFLVMNSPYVINQYFQSCVVNQMAMAQKFLILQWLDDWKTWKHKKIQNGLVLKWCPSFQPPFFGLCSFSRLPGQAVVQGLGKLSPVDARRLMPGLEGMASRDEVWSVVTRHEVKMVPHMEELLNDLYWQKDDLRNMNPEIS